MDKDIIDSSANIERAKATVNAVEWSGDMRVNLTTVLSAGRILARYIDKLENEQEIAASKTYLSG